ncbi:MAG: cytochrome c biogenesis protein CcdA, partial [Thermoplasmata archaeon]
MSAEPCHDVPEDIEGGASQTEAERGPAEQRFQNLTFVVIVTTLIAILVAGSILPSYMIQGSESVSIDEGQALIYYNEACGECAVYINDELIPTLRNDGVTDVVKKDYLNDRKYRGELNALSEDIGIPNHLQSHIATFVRKNATIVLEGHVPVHVIDDLLLNSSGLNVEKILIYQEEMKNPTTYLAWAFEGEAQKYSIGEPISTYLLWFSENVGTGPTEGEEDLLPLVLVTGFVDGLNPCAFAVLLFFISFLFVIRRTRLNVMRMGIIYVLAIFFVYFFIGIGLLGAIVISGQPHLLAVIGSYLLIILGSLSLLQYFFPNLPLSFHMPKGTWDRARSWIFKATLPSALVAGLVVGLCTFPCSGGIYVAVLGLVASETTYFEGIGYLYLYNLMFILPLIVVLLVTSNRVVARKITNWERSESSK